MKKMFKIGIYNIMTDSELYEEKEKYLDECKRVMNVRSLWQIGKKFYKDSKCNLCDDDRNLHVKLPDGRDFVTPCSCNQTKAKWIAKQFIKTKIFYKAGGGPIMLSSKCGDYSTREYIITNSKDFNKKINELQFCFYSSKKLAEKAIKFLQENE